MGSMGKAVKGPTRPRALEVGSRYRRLQGVGRIDYSSHVGNACLSGLCSSPYPVMCKEEGCLCLLGVLEASNIFSGPTAFPDSS